MSRHRYDAVVVGAGPNGLSAAITVARAGRSVLVLEATNRVGGAVQSDSLTLPGFIHDVCSTVYPLGAGSPFFQQLPLAAHGLVWVEPPLPLAHPLDGGRAVVLAHSVDATAAGLGPDANTYRSVIGPLTRRWTALTHDLLSPWRALRHLPALAVTAHTALRSAERLAKVRFRSSEGRALLAGLAAHGFQPLCRPGTAGFALALAAAAHTIGWPFVRGGAQGLADALASILRANGGVIETGRRVESLADVPPARIILLDVTPRQLLQIAGERLGSTYRRRLERYRYGPAAFKVDYALDAPIPWAAEVCRRAGVVHVGGEFDEIAAAEHAIWNGRVPEHPFMLVAQPTLCDPRRAPPDKHTAWVYAHVPHGSTFDMTTVIERQIERFAPGFHARILARHTMPPSALEAHNANLVGGDISGGALDLWQRLVQPAARLIRYTTPEPGVFLCSASTPPGPGVHGLCGHFAARTALKLHR